MKKEEIEQVVGAKAKKKVKEKVVENMAYGIGALRSNRNSLGKGNK